MNIRRLERVLTLLILLVLLGTACSVLLAPRTPTHTETRLVTIPGVEADALAETTFEAGTLVAVHTHDGRDLWVRETALGGAMLVPGTWVLLRRDGHVLGVLVTRSLDAYVEVDLAGVHEIVPVSDVLARLHHGPTIAPTDPPPPVAVTPPPPPPPPLTPLAQMVALGSTHTMRSAIVASCTGGNAHVLFPDGSETDVARSDLHPLRVRAGDHVSALWNGSPYPAVVVDARGSLAQVRWDDASAQWLDVTDVQSVEGTSGVALQGCPRHTVFVDEGARTSVGRLLACEGSNATVLASDGAPRSVTRDSLVRVPLHVGDAIEARWNGSPYDATVLAIGERIHIRWYDGSEVDVDPADLVTLRLHDARSREPATCPAG